METFALDFLGFKKPSIVSFSQEICPRCGHFPNCPLCHPFEPYLGVYYSESSKDFVVKIYCYVERNRE